MRRDPSQLPTGLRALVADDDPVSLRFLTEAIERLGGMAVGVANGRLAVQAATTRPFDVLLLDCRMPDGGGETLLAALRACGIVAPALATSAEVSPASRARLQAAGFVAVLEKPLSVAELARALAPYWPASASPAPAASHSAPPLDEAAALAAVYGDRQALCALRRLLAGELRALLAALATDAPRYDPQQFGERLHRLRAACGFCGATALASAAHAAQRAIAGADAQALGQALTALHAACSATLTALEADEPTLDSAAARR